jgi:hypothetical protein
MSDPDEFERQLRDLTSGQAEPAKFTELSAAERIRRLPPPPAKPGKMSRRNARKARELRKPVGETGRARGPDGSGKPRGSGRRSASSISRPNRNLSPRRQRLLTVARTVGVLVAFVALLYGLHLLGFGPH